MKTQIIFGLMIVTTLSSLNVQAAGLHGAKGAREVIADYAKEVKKYADPKANIRSLGPQQKTVIFDNLTKELEVPAAKKAALRDYLLYSNFNAERPLEILSNLVAAKKLTEGKTDAESKSIAETVDATVNFMADSALLGAVSKSKFLSKTDTLQVIEAIKKFLDMPDQILTAEKKDRKLFTAVMKKTGELSTKSETYEEAFITAIMEVKDVSKEEAIKIARKFTSCE
jgi:hypothetical protein